MLAMSARVRPCRALLCFSSLGRGTTTLPSSCATLISGCTSSSSLPLGPSTVTCCSLIAILALPTGTGFLPIRLIAILLRGLAHPDDRGFPRKTQLADDAEQLTTDVGLAGLAVAH